MLGAAIIVFREAIEAALIISIIAVATRGLHNRNRWIGAGMGAGLIGSLVVAALTGQIAELAEGVGQELFNAGILALAAIMLAWHNIWMARHGMEMARDARQLGQDVSSGNREMSALALVVAFALLREGSETVLFLYGMLSAGEESTNQVVGGGALGLFVGAAAGYGLYSGFLKVPARHFFNATSGLVLLLAASMASQAARFLVQADVLPSLASPLWDSSWLLDNGSMTGRFLHTLVGYDAMPSGIQVLFYVATLTVILAGMRMLRIPPKSSTLPD